jgi:signal transduction histidine kinase
MLSPNDPRREEASREEPAVLLNRKRQPAATDLHTMGPEPAEEVAISDLMHDIRSPLTAITSTLFLLRKEMGEVEGKVQRYLDLLDRQVGRIEGLLHNLDGR